MGNYLRSCKTEFWKEVFEREIGYLLGELEGFKEVLSIGCGPAIVERGLQENGFNVTGLDISGEALEGAPDNVRTVVGSADKMCFSEKSFDAVVYIASLQFIDNYQKAVEETARVLRNNGKIIVMLLNSKSEFFRERIKRPDSYMNKIKHTDLNKMEETISGYFSIETEYFLGIKGQEIFDSQDPKLASLYIIMGRKK